MHIRLCAGACGALWLTLVQSGAASATTVNVDFNSISGSSPTVVAAGTLGQGGTVWNGFLLTNAAVQSRFDLLDEAGSATIVDVVVTDWNGRFHGQPIANDLQSDGMSGGFNPNDSVLQVRQLILGASYDLALYVGAGGVTFEVKDASGTVTTPASSTPTGILPGTAGADFHLLEDLIAYDLGGGHNGLEIVVPSFPFGGQFRQLAGFQIEGSFVPEPTSALLLATGIAGLAARGRRQH